MNLIDQVTEQLATIGLKDEDISEYITGIIEDTSIEEDEKHDVISEFLVEATDKNTEDMIRTLLSNWKKVQQDQQKEAQEKKSRLVEDAKAREEQRRIQAEKEQEENLVLRTAQKELTKEQKEAREKLMQQYGYVADGSEDEQEQEQVELTPRDRRRGKTLPVADPLLAANRNAELVKEKEQLRREQMKQVSDKERERNRMLQQKQKKEKEQDKEKKKTQKGERRRM